jgi:hypothetical protein
MRTTVTIDADVEILLQTAIRERGQSFKEALNSAIRAGLTVERAGQGDFVQQTYAMGSEKNFRWDKALETAAALEDEELVRKLALRK